MVRSHLESSVENTERTLLTEAAAVLHSRQVESRLPVLITVLCVAALTFVLPHSLAPYPKWIPLTVLMVLMVLAKWAHHRGHTLWNSFFGNLANTVTTLFLLWSVSLLVISLPTRKESPAELLLSAGILWVTNVVVFALWYWRIDAGGPNARDRRGRHDCGAFLFPQMTLDDDKRTASSYAEWYPHFIDYLFLAFNTSTALSPTDTAVLSRWAKLMMMAQSAISLVIIVLLAARAINSWQ